MTAFTRSFTDSTGAHDWVVGKDPRGSLWSRTDLKYGSVIGAWEWNGGFAFSDPEAVANTKGLDLRVIRYQMWRVPSELGGAFGGQPMATMSDALDNIISAGAQPLIGLPPIWNEQYPGQPDPWTTAWQQLMISTAGSRAVLYEMGNEPDLYGGYTGQQYFDLLWSGVPALKAYARGLGYEIFVGGPSWANTYSGNLGDIQTWLSACKAAYLSSGNRDWLPDFVSTHTYLITPTENDTQAHAQARITDWGVQYAALTTWINDNFAGLYDRGYPIADQLRLCDTEWNATIDNTSTINNSSTWTDFYVNAMFDMFVSANLFITNQFTIRSHDGGAFDLLDIDGNRKPLYTSYAARISPRPIDTAGLTDSVSVVKARAFTDAEGLTDAIARSLTKTFTDAEGLSDSLNTLYQVDSAGLSDDITLVLNAVSDYTADFLDDVGLLDTATLGTFKLDSLGLSDVVSLSLVKVLTDPGGLTDSFTYQYSQTPVDSLSLTDVVLVEPIKIVLDLLGLTDNTARSLDLVAGTDAESLTDVCQVALVKPAADQLGLTDSVILVQSPVALDNLALTDARVFEQSRQTVELEGLTDTTALVADAASASLDPEGLTDSVSKNVGLGRTDAEGLTDSTSFDTGKAVAASDSEGLTDVAVPVLDAVLDAADTEALTDSSAVAVAKSLMDAEALTDLATVTLGDTVESADAEGLTDSQVVVQGKVLSEQEALTDAAAFDQLATSADAEGLTDTASLMVGPSKSDNLGLSDSALVEVSFALVFADDLAVTDASAGATALMVVDSLALTDSFVLELVSSDALGLTDAAALTVAKFVTDLADLDDEISGLPEDWTYTCLISVGAGV